MFYLILLLAVCVIPFGFGQRPISAPSPNDNPTGFVCMGCPPGTTWRPGPDMPSTGVRMVGVHFYINGYFYAMGGRSMDGVGTDFAHPFEYNPGSNTWAIKSATYPDNQVSNMACGILTDSGTPSNTTASAYSGAAPVTLSMKKKYSPALANPAYEKAN